MSRFDRAESSAAGSRFADTAPEAPAPTGRFAEREAVESSTRLSEREKSPGRDRLAERETFTDSTSRLDNRPPIAPGALAEGQQQLLEQIAQGLDDVEAGLTQFGELGQQLTARVAKVESSLSVTHSDIVSILARLEKLEGENSALKHRVDALEAIAVADGTDPDEETGGSKRGKKK